MEPLSSTALSLAKQRYGEALQAVALRLSRPCVDGKPYAEVYVLLDELPLEEVDLATELLEALPDGLYAGVSVFVLTSRALSEASPALREALADSHVIYYRGSREGP